MRRWFDETILPRAMGNRDGLSSQDYWNHMDRLDDDIVERIQLAISRKAVEHFGLSLDFLYYDPTNFSTHIQEHDDRGNTIPERGNAKDRRNDLRIVGLSLLASRDGGVPLLHRTYPGNRSDYPLFREELPRIERFVAAMGREPSEITLVFDKGNNSMEAFGMMERMRFHYVGAFRPTHNRDLLRVPLSRFHHCYGGNEKETLSYRLKRRTLGREFTVVVTYNSELERHLRSRLDDILRKSEKKARDWLTAANESSRGLSYLRRPISHSSARVRGLLGSNAKYFEWHVGRSGGKLLLELKRNGKKIRERATGFGRTIMFTDRHEWSDEEIVTAYRSKAVIEDEFRRLNDTSYLSDTPEYHWTDSKIKGHQLICFIALQLTALLQRKIDRNGKHVTIDELAYALQKWYQVVLLYSGGNVRRSFRKMDEVQQRLYRELNLESYSW